MGTEDDDTDGVEVNVKVDDEDGNVNESKIEGGGSKIFTGTGISMLLYSLRESRRWKKTIYSEQTNDLYKYTLEYK